ncbi:MAG: 50S ribosomal protein L11 methyltransferase [Daejeonella sp.]
MVYKEFVFTISTEEDFHKDLLINAMSEIGFDTFEELESGFKAYIPFDKFDQKELDALLKDFQETFQFSYTSNDIPHQNWNEVWESNFEPLLINERCYVRATFHEPHPEYEFEIVVDPKMAFGTGHHQTTALMMELMMDENFIGKKVLDMGCGTGILAILASQLGADSVVAIDYDQICFESTVENSQLNSVRNIRALLGSKKVIPDEQYDIILANINRNVLLDQIERYSQVLSPGGVVLFSGFYENTDLEIVGQKSEIEGLSYITHKSQNNWVAAKFHS